MDPRPKYGWLVFLTSTMEMTIAVGAGAAVVLDNATVAVVEAAEATEPAVAAIGVAVSIGAATVIKPRVLPRLFVTTVVVVGGGGTAVVGAVERGAGVEPEVEEGGRTEVVPVVAIAPAVEGGVEVVVEVEALAE